MVISALKARTEGRCFNNLQSGLFFREREGSGGGGEKKKTSSLGWDVGRVWLQVSVSRSNLSHSAVYLDKELFSTLPLFTQVYVKINGYQWHYALSALKWTSFLSRDGESVLHATKTKLTYQCVVYLRLVYYFTNTHPSLCLFFFVCTAVYCISLPSVLLPSNLLT